MASDYNESLEVNSRKIPPLINAASSAIASATLSANVAYRKSSLYLTAAFGGGLEDAALPRRDGAGSETAVSPLADSAGAAVDAGSCAMLIASGSRSDRLQAEKV